MNIGVLTSLIFCGGDADAVARVVRMYGSQRTKSEPQGAQGNDVATDETMVGGWLKGGLFCTLHKVRKSGADTYLTKARGKTKEKLQGKVRGKSLGKVHG